ncbi:MAG TPA: carbohydrate ABC transporter permease [Chloroflexota bacterium]|nr:carbohydrate ABC transporter permease [Chloroflexota bacterium]
MSHKQTFGWSRWVWFCLSRLLLASLVALFLFPLVWMVDTAIKPNAQVYQLPPSLIPWDAEWGNFVQAWTYLPFGHYMFNGLVVSVLGTLLVLVTSSMSAFAFARLRFPGRDSIFVLYLGTLAVPQAVLVIPAFLIMKELGWVNTYQALILPLAFTAFGTFLLRQFFRSLPMELDEAALIDGCSRWGILVRILLPLSQPALGVLGLFTFIGYWNNFLWPLIVITTPDMATIPLGLYQYQGQYATVWNYMMAGAAISMLPGVILVALLQRYLVDGISISGLGGR